MRVDTFALETPRASFFHGAGWTRAVCAEFGHEDRSLVAERGGRVVGVMPLALCRGLSVETKAGTARVKSVRPRKRKERIGDQEMKVTSP